MSNPKSRDGFGDSAVLDLGEIEGTTHTFGNMPDSALDQDDDLDNIGGGDTDQLLGGSGQNPSGLKSYSFWYVFRTFVEHFKRAIFLSKVFVIMNVTTFFQLHFL
jgi:hypothetical protein